MAETIIGLNDPKAVEKYSAFLAVDSSRKSWWGRKMMGRGEEAMTPIQELTDLESEAGERISFDLINQLKQEPIYGDDVLRGNEESLSWHTDYVYIDQVRSGVDVGGRMTRKRTIHDLRRVARARQSDWWGRLFDEYLFMYIGGARGGNADFIHRTSFTGFANNSFTAPDANHIVYGGDATSKASIVADDKMTLAIIDRLATKAETMGGGSLNIPQLQPVKVPLEDGGEGDHFVLVLHPFQWYDVRRNTNTGEFLDIQKAAAGAEGRRNPIFSGAKGMYNDVVIQCHRAVLTFSDYGAGSNVAAARGLFLGSQAGVIAFGTPGNGFRFSWREEEEDRGNRAVITTSTILGVKKTTFNSTDFGAVAVDTAAADPNA